MSLPWEVQETERHREKKRDRGAGRDVEMCVSFASPG